MKDKVKAHEQMHRVITAGISNPGQTAVCKMCGGKVYASAKTLRANSKRVVIGKCPSCSCDVSARQYEITIAERDGGFENKKFTCPGCGLILIAEGFNPVFLVEYVEPEEEEEEDEEYEEA